MIGSKKRTAGSGSSAGSKRRRRTAGGDDGPSSKKQPSIRCEGAADGPWWSSAMDGWSLFKAFCDSTALHGLRYITAEGMPVAHRVVWVVTCFAGLFGAGWLIWSIWLRYHHSPTVTMVQDTSYPLYHIPFPAVTVCSVNKVLRAEAVNFVQEYTGKNGSDETAPYLAVVGALGLISYPTYHRPFQFLNYNMSGRPLMKDVNVTQLMLRVMPRCSDILVACFWKGMKINCCDTFRVQRTEEGFCYSFNSRTAERADGQPWIDDESQLLRNNAAGATTGLEVFFKGQEGQAIEGFDILRGVNVHVHHPDSFPDVAKGLFVPEAKTHVLMAQQVSPSQTESTEEVRAIDLALRRCYFPGEGRVTGLPMAGGYQQDSCFMACRMHFLAAACNCTPYFFPRNIGVRECGAIDLECLSRNNAATRSNKPPRGTPGFHTDESALDCQCLPPCTETQYSVESNYIQTGNLELKSGDGYVDIFYKQMGGVRFMKDVMFGWMDLLVAFGGIAGLFLGFSLLSGAELVYWIFAGVAVCLRWRRERREKGTRALVRRSSWLLDIARVRGLTRTPSAEKRSPAANSAKDDFIAVNGVQQQITSVF
ncbi:pickpocket protein 19-like isoform X2 [Neocloeon triangulifer]|uniref:pickpocket protein 19-like isoform X2 n=1 Tax=Neocloeon triangulifer TaxID=2078957 RepID=UPI00286F5BFC|nr:pickpocket protein 19-like isoform X2 [Neocloeon triangulifer]